MNRLFRLVSLIFLFLISACNTPTTQPENLTLNGRWIDAIVSFEACKQVIGTWSLDMTFLQSGQTLTGIGRGVDQWTFDDNPNHIGSFSGKITSGSVKGSLTLSNSDASVTFDANLQLKNSHLIGTLTSKNLYVCEDKSKVKPIAKVSFITDTEVKINPDSSEPNNTRDKAFTITNDQKLDLSLNSKDVDWFKFEVKETSLITLTFEALSIFEGHLELRDSSNTLKGSLSYNPSELGSQANIMPLQKQLVPGVYYVAVSGIADETFKGTHGEKGNYSIGLKIVTVPDIAFEPNDTPEQATKIESGFSQELFAGQGDLDYFTFTLEKSNMLQYQIQNTAHYYSDIHLFNDKLENILLTGTGSYNITKYQVALQKGKYFISIKTGSKYIFSLSSQSFIDDSFEPNDSANQAQVISSLDTDLYIFPKDEDWFKLVLDQGKHLIMDVGFNNDYWDFYLLDSALNELIGSPTDYGRSSYSLTPGIYYIQIKGNLYNTYDNYPIGQTYHLKIDLQPLTDSNYEPNNSSQQATPIPFGFNPDNLFLTSIDEDWYTFNLPQGGFVDIQPSEDIDVTLYDSALKVRAQNEFNGGSIGILVNSGIYYIKTVSSYGNDLAYQLNINIVPDDKYAPNQTMATAAPITLDFSENNLMIGESYSEYFTFTLLQKSNVKVFFADNDSNHSIDLSGDILKGKTYLEGLAANETQLVILEAGIYLLKINSYTGYGQYQLSVSATPF